MTARDTCPNCGADKPAAFLVCRPCWHDVPFTLQVQYHGAVGLHHHKLITDDKLAHTAKTVLSHLKLYGTAL